MSKIISRTVVVLAIVSLLGDIASEMLYPIIPIYLQSIGFSAASLGLLEGLATAMSGLSKGYFGQLSDIRGIRMPFIRIGYLLSAISKPMLAVFTNTWWIFTARTADRLGKGIRTGARDAVLSDETTPEYKGRVFGFHRTFDTIGAAIGPLIALALLQIYPNQYRLIILLAFIPGILSVLCTFAIKPKNAPQPTGSKVKVTFFSFVTYWQQATPQYRRVVLGFLAFALINSSDMFLLLRLKQIGFSEQGVVGVYLFYNVVYAILSYPAGALGDRWGFGKTFTIGLVLFATVYGSLAFVNNTPIILGLFVLYGFYAASTESIAKAWISNLAAPQQTATAIGTYTAFSSICGLLASTWAGIVWQYWGANYTFVVSGVAALGVAIYFKMIETKMQHFDTDLEKC